MGISNKVTITFEAKSANESFARVAVAAFAAQLNPTLEEIADIKTAVSEAVTNAIIHGYEDCEGMVRVECALQGRTVTVIVSDQGRGIEDIPRAMEPLFTTRPDLDRSGMGFAFMEEFMDEVEVTSAPGQGTTVRMSRKIREEKKRPATKTAAGT